MSTTGKLGVAACIIAGLTVYMAYLGTAASWRYFLTVEECLADAPSLVNQRLRVNGRIVPDSLVIASGRQRATFKMGNADHQLSVCCPGPLPDNLAEAIEVVVEGRLDGGGQLQGDRVLTRCASKYASGTEVATSTRPLVTGKELQQ